MNERIKELAAQAGYTKDMFGVGHWDMPECKKFAKLIVKECLSKVMEVGETNNELIEPIWVAHSITNSIKHHFGVEE